jgi:hypothetical protein
MMTKRTKASCTSQFTRSGSKGRVIITKIPRRRTTDPAKSNRDDQTKAPQSVPHRPVAEQTTPTTPDGVAPEIASATPEAASVKSPLGFHPLAEIFPLLSDDGLQALANDIAEHGLLDEIVLYEGEILDGRCRYLACDRVGVAPKFHDYVGDDPLGFVISRNVHRRHLTTIQRTFAAARAATLPVGANQNTPGLPIGGAAVIFQVSERNIARAKAILRHGASDLVQAAESGKVAISRAAELCELADEKQIVSVKEVAERKRHPRKKKPSASTVNQNTTVGQKDGASQPECSPSADGHDLDIPEFLQRRDPTDGASADLKAEWQNAEAFRRAWGKAPVAVREKFYAEVMRDYRE